MIRQPPQPQRYRPPLKSTTLVSTTSSTVRVPSTRTTTTKFPLPIENFIDSGNDLSASASISTGWCFCDVFSNVFCFMESLTLFLFKDPGHRRLGKSRPSRISSRNLNHQHGIKLHQPITNQSPQRNQSPIPDRLQTLGNPQRSNPNLR